MSTASMHGGTASKSGAVLVIAAIGLLISGGWVISQLMSQGHAVYNVNSMGLHWGLPIVVYDFFLLTSTGLAMVATLSLLFGGVGFRPLVKRTLWLAVAGLAGGVAVLALELGHPFRALIAIPFSFAFASPLWWKVLFVTAYVVALLWMLVRMNAPGWKFESVRISAVFTLVLALAVTVTAGIVYGSQSFRAFWASGDISMAFVFEALLGGLAFTFFFTYLAFGFRGQALPEAVRAALHGRLPSLFALAILVHLLFVGARAVTGHYGNIEGLQVWRQITGSPLFWGEVLLGLMLPLVLMMLPKTRNAAGAQILASLLVMVALFISRYEYIIGGQLVPMFKGAWAPEFLTYQPSLAEWMLLLVAIFLANAVNAFGEKRLNLDA